MFWLEGKGDFRNVEKLLKKFQKQEYIQYLIDCGQAGVAALASATPVDSGLTAASWGFDIRQTKNTIGVYWTNSNVNQGVPIAIILQYGHGTGTGGYVQGRDYINPAIRPIFDNALANLRKEMTL